MSFAGRRLAVLGHLARVGLLSDDEKGHLKEEALDGNTYVDAAIQVFEEDNDLNECCDTLRRVAAMRSGHVTPALSLAGAKAAGMLPDVGAAAAATGGNAHGDDDDDVVRYNGSGDSGDDVGGGGRGAAVRPSLSRTASASSAQSDVSSNEARAAMASDLKRFQAYAGLERVRVSDAIDAFLSARFEAQDDAAGAGTSASAGAGDDEYDHAAGEWALTRVTFAAGLDKLVPPGSAPVPPEQRRAFIETGHSLFDLFDTNGDGVVNMTELVSGLSVLCSGTKDDKLAASFRLFDEDGDGFITKLEMTRYLAAVFRVLFGASPDTATAVGVSPEVLADVTATDVLSKADTDKDGRISLDEFRVWWQDPSQAEMRNIVDATADAVAAEGSPAIDRHRDVRGGGGSDDGGGDGEYDSRANDAETYADAVVEAEARGAAALREAVSALTTLETMGADEVLHHVRTAAAGAGGMLDRARFTSLMAHLAPARGIEADDKESFDALRDALFELFDADADGLVDTTELGSGLSLLCNGDTLAEQVRAAFKMFDVGGDGWVSQQELAVYLASAFRTLFALVPYMKPSSDGAGDDAGAGSADPERIGEALAAQVFADAGLSDGEVLSFEEFKDYLVSSGSGLRRSLEALSSRSVK